MCTVEDGSWSAIGTDVHNVNADKPTMMLDLKGYHHWFRKYLVIHQFGHALGLDHEHQRQDFWEGIDEHIDKDKMFKDSSTGSYNNERAAFERDWLPLKTKTHREVAGPKYDSQSIMHLW